MYDDMVYWTAPDGLVQALDAKTGAVRWETKTDGGMTSGVIVVEGKVLSGRACSPVGANCYIAAHDAKTGKELWRFRTAAQDSDPGGASWAGSPEAGRMAATWGLPGGYDPQRRLVLWGVANPMPNTRRARHDGKFDAVPTHSPSDLYSNSTVALNPDTGKLVWYFQHLPGDDWDQDYTHERTLVRAAFNPNPKFVKWINPDIKRGEQRDISLMVGEGGGIFANDRATGQFLWATPFPFDAPNFLIKNIDVKTGRVYANDEVMLKQPGERHVICSYNTRSYWPTAYHPGENALYVPYMDNCLDMTAASADGSVRERRVAIAREGSNPDTWVGLAKVNVSTGEIQYIHRQHAPGNGAVLATAGDLVFWGDLDHMFRAFDAGSGKVLWETKLNGPVQNSTITYAVNGKQYVAVLTGVGAVTSSLIQQAGLKTNRTLQLAVGVRAAVKQHVPSEVAVSRGLAGQPGISAPTAGRDAHGGPSFLGVVETLEPCLRGPAVCAKRLTAQRVVRSAAGRCHAHADESSRDGAVRDRPISLVEPQWASRAAGGARYPLASAGGPIARELHLWR